MELKGKTVLITGGRRVGGELALMLADRGANVALTYHTSREAIGRKAAEVEANSKSDPRGVAFWMSKDHSVPAKMLFPA